MSDDTLIDTLRTELAAGRIVPFLGPGLLALCPDGSAVPGSPLELVAVMTKKVSVPHKLKNKLPGAAQYIENFKHRKTLKNLMDTAYAPRVTPSPLHAWLAAQPLALIVTTWYDDVMGAALAARADHVVRLTGDCPLMDADLVDRALGLLADSGAHYVSNVAPPSYPDGLDVEAFTMAALVLVHVGAALKHHLVDRDGLLNRMRPGRA